jgi:uncharacterized membrane protein YphA (DoxX/SURF4 family)
MGATLFSHLALAMQISLGIVFLFSALPKLRHPQRFAQNVTAYNILPNKAATAFSWLVIASEAFVAITLLSGLWTEASVLLVIGLLLIFIAAVAINLKRGRRIDCGCFGDANEQISLRALTRLLLLLGLAMLLVVASSAGYAPSSPIRMITNSSAMANLFLAGCMAAFIIVFGSWMLRLPELMLLMRGGQKAQPLSGGVRH